MTLTLSHKTIKIPFRPFGLLNEKQLIKAIIMYKIPNGEISDDY